MRRSFQTVSLGSSVNKGIREARGYFRKTQAFRYLSVKLSPTYDPTSEPGTGIARVFRHLIRLEHVFRVRVVTIRNVGVVVATGVDDHRATVLVEELPKPEAIGVEFRFGVAVGLDQQHGEVTRVLAVALTSDTATRLPSTSLRRAMASAPLPPVSAAAGLRPWPPA